MIVYTPSQITILNVNRTAEGLYGCIAVGVDPPALLESATYNFCSEFNLIYYE